MEQDGETLAVNEGALFRVVQPIKHFFDEQRPWPAPLSGSTQSLRLSAHPPTPVLPPSANGIAPNLLRSITLAGGWPEFIAGVVFARKVPTRPQGRASFSRET
jgi:hypothetical protein